MGIFLLSDQFTIDVEMRLARGAFTVGDVWLPGHLEYELEIFKTESTFTLPEV